MKEIVENLKKNPIYAMSLSSKELFHSNFWAWLFERNIEYARIFFPNLQHIQGDVEREQKNRDVTIWQKGNKKERDEAFIIENKFKSLPYKEQLIRYQKDIEAPENKKGKSFICGVVTGLYKPVFIDDDELFKWSFISYKRIGERIREVAESVETNDTFEKETIFKYSEMIIDLYEVIDRKLSAYGNKWVPFDRDCEALRINDIYNKLVCARLENIIKGDISINTEVGNYKLIIKQYYGQGGAGIDIRYVNKLVIDDDTKKESKTKELIKTGDFELIGIQIEGYQYRWCAQWYGVFDKYTEETDRLFCKVRDWGWFVDYNCDSLINGQRKITDHITNELLETAMVRGKSIPKDRKKDIIPYHQMGNKNNDYTFIHQYWSLTDISFDEIQKVLERDMRFAQEIIEKYLL